MTEQNVTLVDLEPFTNYSMTIDCIPMVRVGGQLEIHGFWSAKMTLTYQTKTDGKFLDTSIVKAVFSVVCFTSYFEFSKW